jgi:hypothetical protein
MSRRSLLCGLAALALLVWTAGPALAEHTHEGKVVKVDGSKLTMTDAKGGKEHSHDVPATAKVLDEGGKEIKLGDLKAGQMIMVTMDKDDKAVAMVQVKKVR